MKKRIRKYLRDARTRSFWRRFISMIACIVVFCTTYALLLPAITMEKTAACGFEEHQHVEECFEEKLTCGLEEGGEHTHTADCYTVEKHLVCKENEHVHNEDCYDPEGRLTCALREHSHNGGCYEMDRILSCGQEETKGHTHTAACYEKILTCGKQVHSHSPACYKQETAESGREESAESRETDRGREDGLSEDDPSENRTTGRGREEPAESQTTDSGRKDDPSESRELEEKTGLETAGNETKEFLYTEEERQEEAGQEIALPDFLTPETSVWFRPAEADDYGWNRVDGRAEILQTDDIRLYYQYTIPAGTLDPDHPETRLSLPENITLTDNQIEYINTAGDERGAQVINGTRLPNAAPQDEETVAAWFRIENHIDENENTDGMDNAGKTDFDIPAAESGSAFGEPVTDNETTFGDPATDNETTFGGPSMDIVLTFDDTVIEENRNHYEDGRLTRVGRDVSGFFSIDLSVDQINFETDTKEARILLVPADAAAGTEENSAVLAMMDENGDSDTEGAEEGDKEGDTFQEADDFQEADNFQEADDPQEEDTFQEDNVAEEQTESAGEEYADTGDGTVMEEDQEEPGDDAAPEEEQAESGNEPSPEEDQAETSLSTLTFEGKDYTVTATFDQSAGIPAGSALSVKEITQKEKDYQNYREQAEQAVGGNPEETVAWVRLFDISIVKDGQVVEPSGPVSVQINYHEAMERAANADVKTVHFEGEKETPRVLNTETEGTATAVEQVSFDTESFSVFAIVGTTIEKTVLASDGKNYKVTVTYGPEAGIPENVDLSVDEITADSSNQKLSYDSYVSLTENALGWDKGTASYVRLFNIKLVDKNNPDVKYQPAEGQHIDVRIELADSESKQLSVVHFSDNSNYGDVVKLVMSNNGSVDFVTDGFSIYVVADTENYTRLVYRFHDASDAIISTQYVKKYVDPDTNETVYEELYDPGLVPEYGQRLVGWAYSADETDDSRIYQLADLDNHTVQKMSAPDFEDETIVDVYAIMDDAWYLRYMDVDDKGVVKILKTVRMPKNTVDKTVDINYVVALPDGTHFEGWYDPVESRTYSEHLYEGDNDNYDSIQLNKHLDLYLKVDNRVWLVFDANAGGSGSRATYTPPQMLYTNTTPPQTTTKPEDPKWKGYTFTGWNTSPDGSGEDWLKVESRTFDADGNLTDIQYSVNRFGETLNNDVILYAQWEPDDNFYRIAYWRQKETDPVDAADSEKKYDFYGYREISANIKTGDTVSATANDRNMTWVAQHLGKTLNDENKFSFNANRSDTGTKTVAGDGSTVLNMYFDRAIMEFIFNQNFPGYTVTEDTSEDLYGYIDGQYVHLTRGDSVTTYTYTMQYTYTPSAGDGNSRYGLINGEYVPLTHESYVSIDDGETEFTGQRYNRALDNDGTQYGIVNGQVIQLTRQKEGGCGGDYYWTYGSGNNTQRYYGQRYKQNNNGTYGFDNGMMQDVVPYNRYTYAGNTYTGTRYVRSNGGDVYTGTRYSGVNGNPVENHTGTQYGIDSHGGYVPLVRDSQTTYSFLYTDSEGNPQIYQGTLYKQDMINTLRGLYGSQMKPGEWPTNHYWQFANSSANSYSGNNRTTLNAAWTSYNISTNAYEYNKGTSPFTTWHLYSTTHSGDVNIVYWRQNADGDYVREDAVSTVGSDGVRLTIGNNKFYAFSMLGYEYGGTGGTPNSSGNSGEYGWHDLSNGQDVSLTMRSGHGDINIYYQRDKFNVTFQSNDADSTVLTYPEKVFYEKNLAFLKDWYTPEESEGKEGYYFVGWYSDANFTKPFDFENEEMPHNDLVLYGRWDTYRVRVVLVPTKANVHNDEVSFPNNQALSFRVDYNDTVSDTNINPSVAERTGYKLVGWYTTPDFRDGTEWNFDTHINSNVSAINMQYQQSADWENNTYGDNDGDHDDVEGILKLYAKWQFDFDEDDLFIEYEVPESYVKRDAQGDLLTVIPQDTKKYTYSPSGTAISTQIKGEPENYIDAFTFSKWELLNSEGIETGVLFGANDTIDNGNINQFVQFREVEDDSGQTRTMKVIVLRGTFTKNNNNKGTVVTFDGNGGKTADNDSAARSLTLLVNEDFTIPGETGTNAFVREGYDLVGWSFDRTTTAEQFREAVAQVGDSTEEVLQDLAKLGMFEIGEKVAADNLKLSDDNNWDPLENTIYAIWEPHRFTVKVKKMVDGEEMSEKEFAFAATGLGTEYSQFTLVNKASKNLTEIPYGTVFSLTETPSVGYTIQSVEAKQTSDANGNPLAVPVDLQGLDGKEYEVKGDIEITYTNKLTAIPVILKKVGYTNTDSSAQEYDLRGASFTVYTTEEGKEIAKDKDGTELKDLDSETDGVFFNGMLSAGTYYLEETVVPDGYYAPLGRFKLVVGQDSTVVTTTWTTGSSDASAGTVSDSTDAGTGIKTFTVSIRNTTGVELPATGGKGAGYLNFAGSLLIGLSLFLLGRNRAVQ